jgi:N-acetylmuramoyl-L-alanine amidase
MMRRWWAVLAAACLAASHVGAFDWTVVKFVGRDYVPLQDVARFYNFTQADYSYDHLQLANTVLRMQGSVNSRELYLNGLKFILSFPIIAIDNNRPAISRIDLSKLVEPVLRPARIQTASARTIVLDAGHGGLDQGARSVRGNEKDFTLDVVLRARDLLQAAGYNVRLTRSADVYIPLELRAAFASYQSNALFISVHFNSGMRGDAEGIETYCLAPRGVPSSNDTNLTFSDFRPCLGNVRDAENIALATALHTALITRLGVGDRGIKRARFVVLRDNTVPGVLIEGGFLTNAIDDMRIANPAFRQNMAQAIFQGVEAYNRAVERSAAASAGTIAKGNTAPPSSAAAATPGTVWTPFSNDVYALPEAAPK